MDNGSGLTNDVTDDRTAASENGKDTPLVISIRVEQNEMERGENVE